MKSTDLRHVMKPYNPSAALRVTRAMQHQVKGESPLSGCALYNETTLSSLPPDFLLNELSHKRSVMSNLEDTQCAPKIVQLIVDQLKRLPNDDSICREFAVEQEAVPDRDVRVEGTMSDITNAVFNGKWCMNILVFLSRYPHAKRAPLILQIANGMKLLHEADIVHRSIFPGNILINDTGAPFAMLANTGIYPAVQEFLPTTVTVSLSEHDLYKSPKSNDLEEITNTIEKLQLNKKLDLYSLTVSIYSIYEGAAPFQNDRTLPGLLQKVTYVMLQGHCGLQKPVVMPDGLWDVLQRCWKDDPSMTIDEVIRVCEANL
ncbi:kinase-like domain-containing protein [Crucibulum laeve]|uniref:non-specific serine/threonine protein kinase n=1 Tax=Crucibulum laeve TaxID=68775 RepID=A0A5C3M269_9AGAR|nr:kinase-like domain-containing protein [Crucibulum laeve]